MMIEKIVAQNFLCFKDITLDLSGPKGPRKTVLIYGENGSGKTNLLMSLRFLKSSMDTRIASRPSTLSLDGTFRAGYDMRSLYSEYHMIGSASPIHLEFTFNINGKDAVYRMSVSEKGLIDEELIYIMNGRKATLFSISEGKMEMNRLFTGAYLNDKRIEVERYWGPHSFLSMLHEDTVDLNEWFIDSNIRPELMDVVHHIAGMMLCFPSQKVTSINPLMNPKKGQMPIEFETRMDALVDAMDHFFTGLYSDIEGVRYVKTRGERTVDYELVFDKRVEGKVITVPCSKESSGTQRLVDEFYNIMASIHGDTVVIDEMDSGIHDVLMMDVFNSIKDSIGGQLIATTHNTMLLQNSDPNSTFILDIDGEGCRSIRSISEITRTQRTNNNTKRYLEGDLGGIPVTGYVDLKDVADTLFRKSH